MPSASTARATPHPDTPDQAAIHEILGGNREMFEVIVRRYNAQLYRTGMAYLRNHAQTEDAMQNAYVKAFLHLDRFQGAAAFSTWLTRIMINECLMLLRRQKLARAHAAEFPEEHAAEDAAPSAAEPMSRAEMKTLLEQAVAALPRNLRAVYVLREIQHLSTAETAACLGVSVASTKKLLERARDRLKTELLKSAAGAELFAYPARYCDAMTARVLAAVAETSKTKARR